MIKKTSGRTCTIMATRGHKKARIRGKEGAQLATKEGGLRKGMLGKARSRMKNKQMKNKRMKNKRMKNKRMKNEMRQQQYCNPNFCWIPHIGTSDRGWMPELS